MASSLLSIKAPFPSRRDLLTHKVPCLPQVNQRSHILVTSHQPITISFINCGSLRSSPECCSKIRPRTVSACRHAANEMAPKRSLTLLWEVTITHDPSYLIYYSHTACLYFLVAIISDSNEEWKPSANSKTVCQECGACNTQCATWDRFLSHVSLIKTSAKCRTHKLMCNLRKEPLKHKNV